MRWEWARRAEPDKCWVDLPATAQRPVLAMFDASMSVAVGDGARTYFWMDAWLQTRSIKTIAPHLFQSVCKRAKRARRVSDALLDNQWIRDITGPLTSSVLYEFIMVWDLIQEVALQQGVSDVFSWKWSSSKYSAASTYKAFFVGRTLMLGAKELWKTNAPGKCKFFIWLVLHERCWRQ